MSSSQLTKDNFGSFIYLNPLSTGRIMPSGKICAAYSFSLKSQRFEGVDFEANKEQQAWNFDSARDREFTLLERLTHYQSLKCWLRTESSSNLLTLTNLWILLPNPWILVPNPWNIYHFYSLFESIILSKNFDSDFLTSKIPNNFSKLILTWINFNQFLTTSVNS